MGFVPISREVATDTKKLIAELEKRRRERAIFYLVFVVIWALLAILFAVGLTR